MSQIYRFEKFANPARTDLLSRVSELVEKSKAFTSGRPGQNTKHSVISNEAFDLMERFMDEYWPDMQTQAAAFMMASAAVELYHANIYSEETGRRAVLTKNRVLGLLSDDEFAPAREFFEQRTGLNFADLAQMGLGLQPEADIYDGVADTESCVVIPMTK